VHQVCFKLGRTATDALKILKKILKQRMLAGVSNTGAMTGLVSSCKAVTLSSMCMLSSLNQNIVW
jgi:hypothetical protein